MTQEEKHLLFKELCTRLPYGVRVCVDESGLFIPTLTYIEGTIICHFKECAWTRYIDTIKPYLRPMSSMTEEEKKDYNSKFEGRDFSWEIYYGSTDWLNEHHFDYRGLIPMGLALPAPEGMYNIK